MYVRAESAGGHHRAVKAPIVEVVFGFDPLDESWPDEEGEDGVHRIVVRFESAKEGKDGHQTAWLPGRSGCRKR